MNLLQRAWRSVVRKPVRSLLLLLVISIISVLFLSGMASRNASIALKDNTRQAIGAGFLMTKNVENESKRVEKLSQKIGDKDGSLEGYHQKKEMIEGQPMWRTWTDNVFHCIKTEDIETVASVDGISDYNITTAPTRVKGSGFERIEDPEADQTYDFGGVALIGNLDMKLDANVLSGNVSIIEGRMVAADDKDVCVISEELARKNGLKVGDTMTFHPIEEEEPVSEEGIIGIYQVKEKMTPYMSGDTYRSENVIFTDLHFPEKAEQDTPLFERACFKVGDVDDYEDVKKRIMELDLDWELYDLIDNNGNLNTMAGNFNDLKNISEIMLLIVAGGSFIILFLIFLFWIRNRNNEMGVLLSLGVSKSKILFQIITEALIIGVIAVGISFAVAPATAQEAATYLVGQQEEQAQLEKDAVAGQVATEYKDTERMITGVQAEVTKNMLLVDGLGIGALIILSTAAASILVFRKNPKSILSEMS